MEDAIRSIKRIAKPSPAQALETNAYECGDQILEEGHESPFFFVILSGQVRLSHGGTKIRILGEQDIFGLESLILRKPSYYTVVTLDKCRIAKYGAEALDHLIRESPIFRLEHAVLYSEVGLHDRSVGVIFKIAILIGSNTAHNASWTTLIVDEGVLLVRSYHCGSEPRFKLRLRFKFTL